MAREVLDEGGNQAAVVEALGVHPYTAQKVYSQAQAFRMPALEATYRRLLRMDEDAKTSQVSLDLALDLFIAQTDHR
jgi:DNA polymerase III delta subunit